PPANPSDPAACTELVARTVPSDAGPAAVEVTNDAGLRDRVLGGFTYVDLLEISFIDPAVVATRQSGSNDRVEVVGRGFHAGIALRAAKSGDASDFRDFAVDQHSLVLQSSERMSWLVPDFRDASGRPYRGFVDVELSDENGRHFVLPEALFYGRGGVDR